MGESAHVIKSYKSAYPDPLKLKKGDRVTVEARDCEWPGWIWATENDGRAGWIPEAYLSISDTAGELLRDYDATELDAEAGDTVEVLEQESSWARCRKTDGTTGWLPEDVLKV